MADASSHCSHISVPRGDFVLFGRLRVRALATRQRRSIHRRDVDEYEVPSTRLVQPIKKVPVLLEDPWVDLRAVRVGIAVSNVVDPEELSLESAAELAEERHCSRKTVTYRSKYGSFGCPREQVVSLVGVEGHELLHDLILHRKHGRQIRRNKVAIDCSTAVCKIEGLYQ